MTTTARAERRWLARTLGYRAGVFPQWGQLNVWLHDDQGAARENARVTLPTGIDMAKVIADRMRLPVVALAFVSAVSLIPGVYLFRTAEGVVSLVMPGAGATPDDATRRLQSAWRRARG